MKTVTVNTVQGIGDTIWVYRKLAPLYDVINFNILTTNHEDVQKRSGSFLQTLDKCGQVTFTKVPSGTYDHLARQKCVIRDANHYDYSVNAWIEDGVHLDDIDQNPVLWDLNLKLDPVSILPENYLLVYASGHSRHERISQLSDLHWLNLIAMAAKKYNVIDVVFIGAEYDRWKVESILKTASGMGLGLNLIPFFREIKESMYIIKHAKFFISYQSGLCMISEELGTPTLMIWFPKLKKMETAWIRKENIANGLIRHGYFDYPIDSLLNIIRNN